jgi:Zn-dependent peptidase ImmA (M78 family)
LDVVASPSEAAIKVRALLGVSMRDQTRSATMSDALNTWIRAVESLGVLVFQMSRVSPEECRGFSIYEEVMPVIVLNGADGFGARQFTLMHELAHLISRTSAICDVWREKGIEARCNEFAAELLMPRREVDAFLQVTGDPSPTALALHFKVSRSAAAVRLRTLGRMTQTDLEGFLRDAREAALAQREAAKERPGGPSPYLLKVRNLGSRFVGTVLDALHDDRITYVEAAQILESKVQALDKLEAELVRRGTAP